MNVASRGGWSLRRGASVRPDGTIHFSVWAPRAGRVAVRVASGRPPEGIPLEPTGDGVFEGILPGEAGADYFYRIDDERDRPDPVSRFQPEGVHGASRVIDPAAFPWTDEGWTGPEMADLVIYELHVGTFTPAGTFDAVAERLPYLRELGVTAIELMPVAAFPGTRNWGYDGVHPYAPQASYGGPEGLRRLVDAAHRHGLSVLLDVVYNHLGPEGNYLGEFGPYFTDRYHTPWGQAINFDGSESDEVRRYFIDNALYWVTEHHVDGLRLDAIHSIYDFSAWHVLEELSVAVHAEAQRLGRRVVVIAESDRNDPRLVRPRSRGGHGLDGQWNDDFHHAVHAALTRERSGYYADFGGHEPVAKALRDRFVNDGRPSVYRRRRHGAPAADVPPDRFVVFVQNHDQVGNRARGERLSTLLPAAGNRLAAALLLLSPYVPLLFMGEEYGETNTFLYFVSHGDAELVEAVREGRRREFESFVWSGDIPDPQAQATFAASRLDWTRPDAESHRELLALHRDLLKLRREEPALRPATPEARVFCESPVPQGENGWVALELRLQGKRLLATFNLSAAPREVRLPFDGTWRPRLSTDDARYGGSGTEPPRFTTAGGDVVVRLPGLTAVLYEERRADA